VFLATYPLGQLAAQDTTAGKQVYVKWCAGCHGDGGAGDGPAASYMLPRPRNFTGAVYQIRATASGQLPTDADLVRSIDEGLGGTAMPGWKTRLSEAERRDVIAYIKTFSAFFTDTTQHPVALKFAKEPGGGTAAAALRTGRLFYDSIGCRKCHGDQGRGDGPSAPTLKDDPGQPIFAADLTENWRFNGGGTTADIYRRLRTGLDGTPMPSFSDLIDQKFLTEDELWRLAQYVRSLSPAQTPEVRVDHVAHLGRLGAGGAHGGLARHADRVGRPLAQPRHDVAAVRAARPRRAGERRRGAGAGGPLARPAGGAVPPRDPDGNGAALLPHGRGDGARVPVALDERAATDRGSFRGPRGGGGRARGRAVRHPGGRGRAGGASGVGSRTVAARFDPRPCDPRYR